MYNTLDPNDYQITQDQRLAGWKDKITCQDDWYIDKDGYLRGEI